MFTNLAFTHEVGETAVGISSLMDAWLILRVNSRGVETIRTLQLLKSRGMAHDTSRHIFVLSDKGIAIHGNEQNTSAARAHQG